MGCAIIASAAPGIGICWLEGTCASSTHTRTMIHSKVVSFKNVFIHFQNLYNLKIAKTEIAFVTIPLVKIGHIKLCYV